MKLLRMAFSSALRGLRRNRPRSGLTILGVVVGVAAVITTIGISQGATRAIENQIARMGTNLLVVMPGTHSRDGARGGWGGASSLTVDDARAIEREASLVQAVTYTRTGPAQIIYGHSNWATGVVGTTPEFRLVGNDAVTDELVATDRQGHQPGNARDAARW